MAFSNYPSYVSTPTQKAIYLKGIMDQGGSETDAAYQARLNKYSGGLSNVAASYNAVVAPTSGPTYSAPAAKTGQTKNAPSTYSKSGVADSLGISINELEERAQDAGYSNTESYYNSKNFKNDQVNSYYDPSMSMLNAQQTALMGNQQNFENIATSPYDQAKPLINQAAQQGQGAIAAQQGQAGVQEQNALAAARRLYDELTSRNKQAFGSSALGSVGQAASEVLGRSAQEQFGSVRNTAGQTQQSLMTAARDLTDRTNAQLQSLELQKSQALSQAKMAFQDKLDYINQQKNMVGQAKAAAKLSALQDYRDNIQQMASQADAVKSQIMLTAQANGQNRQQQYQQYLDAMNGNYNQGATNVYNQGASNTNAINDMQTDNSMSAAAPVDAMTQQYGGYNPVPSSSTNASGKRLIGYDSQGNPVYQ